MAASYDDAVAALYQAPHEAFVAERKRLSVALKLAGDKAGAARLIELRRPPLSAWAVNQLWWQAGDLFNRLFAAAHALRTGDQSAAAERRDALAALKVRAASILVQSGHGANEGTLRRVATTLAALAAAGGFEPDAPGALAADRDPPGFDVAALGPAAPGGGGGAPTPPPRAVQAPVVGAPRARPALSLVPPAGEPGEPLRSPRQPETRRGPAVPENPEHAGREAAEQDGAERIERERAERERIERAERERIERERVEREQAERLRIEQELERLKAERATRAAERERIQANLPALRGDLERRRREVERLKAEVRRVEGLAEEARAAVDAAERRLAALRTDE